MATKLKYDNFAIVMLILVVMASLFLLYSENPFLFDFSGKSRGSGAGVVSVYVLPHDDSNDSKSTQNKGIER